MRRCCFPAVITVVLLSFLAQAQEHTFVGSTNKGTRTIPGHSFQQTVPVRSVLLTSRSHSQSQTSRQATGNNLVLQTFAGPSGTAFPPDPIIAAGPFNLVATVNAVMTVFDKSGHVLSSTPLDQFMLGHHDATANFWDSRTIFDSTSGRFMIISAWGDENTKGAAYLAVSATSDATGRWNIYQLENNGKYWVDYPQIGTTANSLILVPLENPFVSTGGPGLCPLVAIGLPELLAGNPQLNITRFDNVYGGAECPDAATPVQNLVPSTTAYLMGLQSATSLNFVTVDTSAAPALRASSLTIPHYDPPQPAVQPNTSTRLNPGASSILSAVFRDGSIWANQTVHPVSAGGNAAVRWFEINPATIAVTQTGDVAGIGDAFIGAINVLPDGEVNLVYTTSSGTHFASAGYSHRNPSDPPGTMPLSGTYFAGTSDYTINRWGDFAGLSIDPDGSSAWGIAQVATSPSGKATAIVQLASAASAAEPQVSVSVTPAAATVRGGQPATFSVSVTAQNVTSPISFSCSGLPQGSSCTFTPATLSGTGTTTLTIATAARTASVMHSVFGLWMPMGMVFGFAGSLPMLRRKRLLLVLFLLVLAFGLVACGGASGASNSSSSPSAVSFNVTVTATSGGLQASGPISLTVQ